MSEISKMGLQRMLKHMGYSEKAVSEILKWYSDSSLQAEKHIERDLHSGDIGQQKRKR